MSTLPVTCRSADVKPPRTQSRPSTTAPLASNRAIGLGAATVQVKAGPGEPASAPAALESAASTIPPGRAPAQSGAGGRAWGPGADDEQAAPTASNAAATRITFATPPVYTAGTMFQLDAYLARI